MKKLIILMISVLFGFCILATSGCAHAYEGLGRVAGPRPAQQEEQAGLQARIDQLQAMIEAGKQEDKTELIGQVAMLQSQLKSMTEQQARERGKEVVADSGHWLADNLLPIALTLFAGTTGVGGLLAGKRSGKKEEMLRHQPPPRYDTPNTVRGTS